MQLTGRSRLTLENCSKQFGTASRSVRWQLPIPHDVQPAFVTTILGEGHALTRVARDPFLVDITRDHAEAFDDD